MTRRPGQCDLILTTGQTYTRTLTAPRNSRSNIWVDVEQFDGVSGLPLADVAAFNDRHLGEQRARHRRAVALVAGRLRDAGTRRTIRPARPRPARHGRWPKARWPAPRGEETYILIANTSTFDGPAQGDPVFEDGTSTQPPCYSPCPRTPNRTWRSSPSSVCGSRQAVRSGHRVAQARHRCRYVVERAMYWNSRRRQAGPQGTNALATKLQ